jgi:uncharacterized membrane protein
VGHVNQVDARQVAVKPEMTSKAAPTARVDALDLLRGVVMVLMTLDHVRDFFTDTTFDPLDLTRTSVPLFLTRWITHYCAPTFVFLAGCGAYLSRARGRTREQLAWFLLTRGIWLVFLEFTLVHLGWHFNFLYAFINCQVIWALGWSMVAMAGVIYLPTWLATALGIAIVAGHNTIDLVTQEHFGWLWAVLFRPGPITLWKPPPMIFIAYPVIPWLGVMMMGYGFGTLWLMPQRQRRPLLVLIGGGMVALFAVLRSTNVYGDPTPWGLQANAVRTFLATLHCQKYPPSLLYVLMTLGPAILLLAWCDKPCGRVGGFFVTFGRVPMFFYLLHVPLIHLIAIGFAATRYDDISFMLNNLTIPTWGTIPTDYGYPLWVTYVVWVAVVALLYPPCVWFAGIKRRHNWEWLSYF